MSNIIPTSIINNTLIARGIKKQNRQKDLTVRFYEDGYIFSMNEGVCRFLEQRILSRPEELYTVLTRLLSQRLIDLEEKYPNSHLTALCYQSSILARDSVTTILSFLANGGTLQEVFTEDRDEFHAKKAVVLIAIYATMTKDELRELLNTGFVTGMNAVELLAFIDSVYG